MHQKFASKLFSTKCSAKESESVANKADSEDANETDEILRDLNMKGKSKSFKSLSHIFPTTDYNQSETDTDQDFCFSDSKSSEEVDGVRSHDPRLPDPKKQKLRSDYHLETLRCEVCNKGYKHRQSLQRHINKEHPKETRVQTCYKIECQEKSCSFTCRFLHQLRKHLVDSHNFHFNFMSETFSSYQGQLSYSYLCILDMR